MIDETLPEVIICDKNRLAHILVHLLLNSIKYTITGKVTLSISRDVELEDCINFTVVDTGVGMNPSQIESLKSSTYLKPEDFYNRLT